MNGCVVVVLSVCRFALVYAKNASIYLAEFVAIAAVCPDFNHGLQVVEFLVAFKSSANFASRSAVFLVGWPTSLKRHSTAVALRQ